MILELLLSTILLMLGYHAWAVAYGGTSGSHRTFLVPIPAIVYISFFALKGYALGTLLFMIPVCVNVIGMCLYFFDVTKREYPRVRASYWLVIRTMLAISIVGAGTVYYYILMGDVGLSRLTSSGVFYMWLSSTLYLYSNLKY